MNGAELKRRRQAAGMSPRQFAAAVGVSVRTVTNWESGATSSDRQTGRIDEVLGTGTERPLARYDDTELLAELLTRASRRGRKERDDEPSATITPLSGRRNTQAHEYDPDIHEAEAADEPNQPTKSETGDHDDE